jgi:uncharacterized caspase-like protein
MKRLHPWVAGLLVPGLATLPWPVWAQPGPADARNLQVAVASQPPARQEQRLALVIGNAAYKEAPLLNPVNDARAMAAALRQAGFTVLLHTDVDHRGLLNAVREFGNRLKQGGVGVFYFAGHGMQIKGRNYLVPVAADIQREDEVAYAALDAQAVLDKMEAAGNGTNLMILDACRNNPFARSFRSSTQGLAQMEAPVGTLVAFATAPGAVASDGNTANGLYTQHLLNAMRTHGAKVEDVFKQVRAAVRRDSQGKQIPWESTSLEGDFYFHAPVPAPPPVDPAVALDHALWDGVKGSTEAADLRAYLRRFPQGLHALEARTQLQRLNAQAQNQAAAQPQVQRPAEAPPTTGRSSGHDQRTQELLKELGRPPAPAAVSPNATAPAAALPPPTTAATVRPPPVAMQVAVPATDSQRSEVDRRTAEWLAELAAKPPLNPPMKAPAGVPASNRHGFTVGDRWNYQVVDRFRGEVVRNFSLRITKINADGSWSSGNSQFDELGRLTQWTNGAGEARRLTPHGARWWADMRVGDRRRFEYDEHWPALHNRVSTEARVVGEETVRVPAGEFKTLKIVHKGTVSAVGRLGFGSVQVTLWYAPELHTLVAQELETTWDGRPGLREREELTSFTLVGNAGLAQR